ncbi:MAG: serine protein kinase RIO [Candidatus Diapherotrites archaeon]
MKPKEFESLKEFIKEESTQRVFAKVFDEKTIAAVHKLATKGLIEELEFVISTGKEAHVFRARDRAGNFRAVKIYRITTSDFKNMSAYIQGDQRFKQVPKEKHELIFAWTKKEFKNLELARRAGVRVPLPLGFEKNVLVMEFIGVNGIPSNTMKETDIKDLSKAYNTMIEWIARMYKAGLVHSDLSEYNVLVRESEGEQELVLIDIGQAVLASHPKAREFFERDLRNVSNYFSKKGLKKSFEEAYEEVKKAVEFV